MKYVQVNSKNTRPTPFTPCPIVNLELVNFGWDATDTDEFSTISYSDFKSLNISSASL